MMKPYYFLCDFPERKSVGKNYVAECPQCGTKHLHIAKATGLMHCFYAGCGFGGKLRDFWENPKEMENGKWKMENPPAKSSHTQGDFPSSTVSSSSFTLHSSFSSGPAVAMLPTDYKPLSGEVLKGIKPIASPLPPEATEEAVSPPDADRAVAQQYLAAQGISLQTALKAGLGCLTHRCFGKEEEKSSSQGRPYHCLAYVNRVNGVSVNVKYRSVDADVSGKGFTKCWAQESPTKPCPPYNIDCINPLLVAEEEIDRLVITEGEKDVLSLLQADIGTDYVISVPNGAASDLAKCFEAFVPWLDKVQRVILCGDTDLPGRTLTRNLQEYFGPRAWLTTLPHGCKDISDVLQQWGAEAVREVIASAYQPHEADIVTVGERTEQVLGVLRGEYDHGYSVGHGPLTDRIFHPTDQGGLMIVTGKPNCGKTDFLNDLTCRLMAKTGRYVCYLSFEVPDKNKHIAQLVRLMLGRQNTAGYTREQLQPFVGFLHRHMVHLDLQETPPTPQNILERAERIRQGAPLRYLIIDPYLFIEVEAGKNVTETQAIKTMLTQLQSWGRAKGVWVVIVAHPRKLQKVNGSNTLEDIDMYTIAGSANWANLADFILSLTRVKEQDRAYTRLDMLKVRDQELCQTGSVYYVRQPCGRYDERESEEQVMAEMRGAMLPKEQTPWKIEN